MTINQFPQGNWFGHDGPQGDLPYWSQRGSGLIADFYENKNMKFDDWLIWFRRWMFAAERDISSIEAWLRAFTVKDTDSVKMTLVGSFNEINPVFDPVTGEFVFPKTEDIEVYIKSDVKISEKTDPKKNAISIQEDGIWAADYTDDIGDIINDITNIENIINNIIEGNVQPVEQADFENSTFIEMPKPRLILEPHWSEEGSSLGNYNTLIQPIIPSGQCDFNFFQTDHYRKNDGSLSTSGVNDSSANIQILTKSSEFFGSLVPTNTPGSEATIDKLWLHSILVSTVKNDIVVNGSDKPNHTYYFDLNTRNETYLINKIARSEMPTIVDLAKEYPMHAVISEETWQAVVGQDFDTFESYTDYLNAPVYIYNYNTGELLKGSRANIVNSVNNVSVGNFFNLAGIAPANYKQVIQVSARNNRWIFTVAGSGTNKAKTESYLIDMQGKAPVLTKLSSTYGNLKDYDLVPEKGADIAKIDGDMHFVGWQMVGERVLADKVSRENASEATAMDSLTNLYRLDYRVGDGSTFLPVIKQYISSVGNNGFTQRYIAQNFSKQSGLLTQNNIPTLTRISGLSLEGAFDISPLWGNDKPIDFPNIADFQKEIQSGWDISQWAVDSVIHRTDDNYGEFVVENSPMNISGVFKQKLTYNRTHASDSNFPMPDDPKSEVQPVIFERNIKLSVFDYCKNGTSQNWQGNWQLTDWQSISKQLTVIEKVSGNTLDTDVGNHMSLSADKNTLTLTRKKLNGTAVASDTVPVGIGDILNEITKIWNYINNLSNGGGELTVYEPIWDGNVGEGGTVPHLENGEYLITVVSDVLGAFDISIQFNNSAPINFNSIISPYAPASPDGTIWVLQAILTGANSPVFKTTMTKNVGGSSTVSSSNNGCHITNIKKIVKKKL